MSDEGRVRLHQRFDRLWKTGAMTRRQAYRWLATVMRLTEEEAHIGVFSREQVNEAHRHLDSFTSWTEKPKPSEA